ncbi:MAG: FG-GAP-like repeat-containing protein [Bdellovibrionota bacterium]|nr:MAG: FG-GAP-like repeat-containing protein [Bdellovibrionota bacterium]
MALTFGSNINALRAQRLLGQSIDRLGRATERLSSGMRINRASDDAASLSVAMSLGAASRVYSQGIRNVNDGISALSIADSGLETLSNILVRQRELASQAANGSLSSTQRRSLAQESDQLTLEYNRTLGSLKFNGLSLLTASFTNMRIQGGFGTDGSIEFGLTDQIRNDIGNQSYTNVVSKVTGATTTDIATADFDGDGDLDIITSGMSGTNLSIQIHRQDAPNNFTTTMYSTTLTNASTTAVGKIAVGDFNGDGVQDFAVGSYHTALGSTYAVRYLNTGSGTAFTSSTVGVSTAAPTAVDILAEDLDGDGDLDLGLLGASIYALSNNGSGTFTNTATLTGTYYAIEAADLNNDGQIDLAGLTTGFTPTIQAFLRSGSGYSAAVTTSMEFMGGTTDFALGDLNRDGFVDLVYQNGSQTVRRLGNGSGSFSTISGFWNTGAISGNDAIKIGDLNGDGLLDILVGYSNKANAVYGNIDGSMTAGSVIGLVSTGNITMADIDGDGVNDILSSAAAAIYVDLQNTVETTNARYVDLRTAQTALDAIDYLEDLIEEVQRQRGVIGAAMSRLESFVRNLQDLQVGSESARSRIVDSDIALESAEAIRQQILQDVGSAILGQANQAPGIALSLLQSAGSGSLLDRGRTGSLGARS